MVVPRGKSNAVGADQKTFDGKRATVGHPEFSTTTTTSTTSTMSTVVAKMIVGGGLIGTVGVDGKSG